MTLVICPYSGFCSDGKTCIHGKFHENDHRLYGCLDNDRIDCPACVEIEINPLVEIPDKYLDDDVERRLSHED